MDSRLSESDSVNGAESFLSTSPGAASTSSRERLDSDSSDRWVWVHIFIPPFHCLPNWNEREHLRSVMNYNGDRVVWGATLTTSCKIRMVGYSPRLVRATNFQLHTNLAQFFCCWPLFYTIRSSSYYFCVCSFALLLYVVLCSHIHLRCLPARTRQKPTKTRALMCRTG